MFFVNIGIPFAFNLNEGTPEKTLCKRKIYEMIVSTERKLKSRELVNTK